MTEELDPEILPDLQQAARLAKKGTLAAEMAAKAAAALKERLEREKRRT